VSTRLPSHPDFAQLRRQAKDLRKAHGRGEAEARARVAAVAELRTLAGSLGLAQAQFVIAREHGFPSWAKLKHRLEHEAATPADLVARFCTAACSGDAAQAGQILREHPQVAQADIAAACAAGASDVVLRLLRERPELARMQTGPNAWPPLIWLCWSSVAGAGGREAVVAIARALIDAGGDANAGWIVKGDPDWRETALSGVCSVHRDRELALVLLRAGADPNDDDSLYFAYEHRDRGVIEALLEHGCDLRRVGLQHQLDWENPEMLRWLLERGADPGYGTARETALHWAIKRGRSREVIELLVEHGADVFAPIASGGTQFPEIIASTPIELAIRCLHRDAIEILLARGVSLAELDPVDRLLLACARGDAAEARRLHAADPDAISRHPALRHQVLACAAAGGNAAGIELALASGCGVDGHGWMGGRPLHQAAMHGLPAIVDLLLHHGAVVDDIDNAHRTTPLSWACYGSGSGMNPRGDFVSIVERLIAAGSPLPKTLRGTDEVRAVLRRHGVGDEEHGA